MCISPGDGSFVEIEMDESQKSSDVLGCVSMSFLFDICGINKTLLYLLLVAENKEKILQG